MASGLFVLLAVAALPARAAVAADPACRVAPPPGELTLQQAAQRYLRCNPLLEQSRAAVEAARGDLRSADHAPNPVLGLSVSNINPQAGTGGGALWHRTVDSAVRMDQLIERGGKLAARRDAAGGLLRAAEAQLEDATQRGLESLVEAYAAAAAADARALLLADAAASYGESLAAMNRRLAAGDVAVVEVQRTSLDAARADADAEAARLERLRARGDVALALGTDSLPDTVSLAPLDAVLAQLRPVEPAAASVPVAGDVRPDLRAATARVEAGQGVLRAAQAARKRDVDVTVGFDHWPASVINTQGTGDSYTLGVSVPLFIHDSGRGGVQRASADLRTAEADLGARLQAAELERRQLADQLRQTEALAARYQKELLPAAEGILGAAETAYRRGGYSVLDLLDARRTARQVAVAAIDARRDAILYRARLQVALGRSPLDLTSSNAAAAAENAP